MLKQPGSISFHNINLDFTLENCQDIISWISRAISEEGFKPGELDFSFMSDDALLEVNKEHLQHDFYTDIITFEYSEDGFVSGDILISLDRVNENAREYSNNFKDELHRVIIHGVLHLCGYKDKTDTELVQMRAKEDYYLSLRSF